MDKKKEKKEVENTNTIPPYGVPLRPIDVIKFNQYFNIPLELIYNNNEYIDTKIGRLTWITFFAWRGYCFEKQMRPNEEILFTEFASTFSIEEVVEMYNRYFPKKINVNDKL